MNYIEKLIKIFAKFPTIGQRTASRFVFYLLKLPKQEVEELIKSIIDLKNNVQFCLFCFNPCQNLNKLCSICSDSNRNKKILCVVEKEIDLIAIEKTKKYKGLYFVFGSSSLYSLKNNFGELRTKELNQRIANPEKFGLTGVLFSEIIIAVNPTPEGKITSSVIQKSLKELPQFSSLKITHLGRGLPIGGELEYADEETLESAFQSRK